MISRPIDFFHLPNNKPYRVREGHIEIRVGLQVRVFVKIDMPCPVWGKDDGNPIQQIEYSIRNDETQFHGPSRIAKQYDGANECKSRYNAAQGADLQSF